MNQIKQVLHLNQEIEYGHEILTFYRICINTHIRFLTRFSDSDGVVTV